MLLYRACASVSGVLSAMMSGSNMEVDDGAGALGGGEECNCEGACACGRKVDGDAAVEE